MATNGTPNVVTFALNLFLYPYAVFIENNLGILETTITMDT